METVTYDQLNSYFALNPCEGLVRTGEKLERYTSFGCGGRADFFCDIYTVSGLRTVIVFCRIHDVPFKILGYGTDILVCDEGVRGIVMRLIGNEFYFVKQLDEMRMRVGSRVSLRKLISITAALGLSGVEWFMGIPASVGGALSLNAGAYGRRIADIVEDVTVYVPADDTVKTLCRDELIFQYRHGPFYNDEIILNATLQFETGDPTAIIQKADAIEKVRETKLPHGKSAGCIFKNPQDISAGALIDMLGLKGKREHGAVVSEKHANIIINESYASTSDVLKLIQEVHDTVLQEKGIDLDLEIKIWS